MSLYIDKKDGEIRAVHIYDEQAKSFIRLISEIWDNHAAMQEVSSVRWPEGVKVLKNILKEV